MALELVSGADFLCKLMCGAGPVDLRESPGAISASQTPNIDDFQSVKKSYIKNPHIKNPGVLPSVSHRKWSRNGLS